MNREEDQRVVAQLRQRGLDVSSVWDLVHTADDYADAVPFLVTLLSRTADYDVKEGIVRALSLKRFRSSAFEALLSVLEDLFDDMTPRADTLKWAIGNALSMIAFAMGRIKHRGAVPVLIRLLDEPQVAAQAACALGKMNAHEAQDALLRLARGSKGLAKKEAGKALARLAIDRNS